MIIDLPSTSTSRLNKALVDLRESGGAVALGRVLTLVICTDDTDAEDAIAAANDASREHPCRVLVLARGSRRGTSRLDGQIRVGGDAGASEVVVARLYGELADHGDAVVVPLLLPDAPVVVWWTGEPPAVPSQDPIGAMAQRRITDSAAARRPGKALEALAAGHADGDTDLAWSRLTLWRGLLAAALDQPPFDPVLSVTVAGASDSPSTDLLAAWLGLVLSCRITRVRSRAGTGVVGVRLERRSGDVELVRPEGSTAVLTAPNQPERHVALPHRSTRDCLAEELRRLDPDDVYGDVLTIGLARLAEARKLTETQAEREGSAPTRAGARRRVAERETEAMRTARAMEAAEPEGEPQDLADPDAAADVQTDTNSSEVVTQSPEMPAPDEDEVPEGTTRTTGTGGAARKTSPRRGAAKKAAAARTTAKAAATTKSPARRTTASKGTAKKQPASTAAPDAARSTSGRRPSAAKKTPSPRAARTGRTS